MQQLPHYLQRRQMTFTPNRFPRRMLEQARREFVNMNVVKKARKHRRFRRRPKNLSANFGHRQENREAWLPTHLWHVKRFKMIRLWGLVLPKRPNDRSSRAGIKGLLRQCVAMDDGAQQALIVTGKENELLEKLNALGRGWGLSPVLSGARAGQTNVFGNDSVLVAPVTFVWRPGQLEKSGERELLVWVHASAAQQVRTLFEEKQLTFRDARLSRIELRGPEALAVLGRTVHSVNGEGGWDQGKLLPTLLEGSVFHERVRDPRLAVRPVKGGAARQQEGQGDVEKAWELVTRSPAVRKELWEASGTAPVAQNRLDVRRGIGGTDVEILVEQRPGPVPGLAITVPSEWARVFWGALMLAKAHAIGLQDWLAIHHQELGLNVFPFDFPETVAGKAFVEENASRLISQHQAIPHQKTPNFLHFDSSRSPFRPMTPEAIYRGPVAQSKDLDNLSEGTYVPVRIQATGRGAIKFNSALLEPVESDLAPPFAAFVGPTPLSPPIALQDLSDAHRRPGNRPEVGHAVGGGISLRLGRGYGVGLVRADYFAGKGKKRARVLVRNPAAPDVFEAHVWPIRSSKK